MEGTSRSQTTIPRLDRLKVGHFRVGCLRLSMLFSRCPPCLHQCRQFLPHSCTHGLATSGLLLCNRRLLWSCLSLLLCPPCPLSRRYLGTRRCTHLSTLRRRRWHSLARLWGTTTTGSCWAWSHEGCNCIFDAFEFLSKLRHYALNVHVVLSERLSQWYREHAAPDS